MVDGGRGGREGLQLDADDVHMSLCCHAGGWGWEVGAAGSR